MQNNQNTTTKAEVQTIKLNKMPIVDENNTEFSAEVAAEAFEKSQGTNQSNQSRPQ